MILLIIENSHQTLPVWIVVMMVVPWMLLLMMVFVSCCLIAVIRGTSLWVRGSIAHM